MHRMVGTLLAVLCLICASSAGAADCASAVQLRLENTTITAARVIAANGASELPEIVAALKQLAQMTGGPAQAPATPAFCRVQGVIKPSASSHINFEVWLPSAGWNERYWGVGNGGFAGYIAYSEMMTAIARGYAVSSTDAGHALGFKSAVALSDPEKFKDFAERAIHLTAVAARAIVAAHFGRQSRYAYFSGCSNGGRQGLIEAQRYPQDYDGILAGAPAAFFPGIPRNAWAASMVAADPRNELNATKLKLLHRAALEQCDASDGLKDDLISDPLHCRFDPAKLRCAGGGDE